LKSGPTFLYRNLPFQFTAWIDRMKLMLLPLATLLIPLFKLAPPLCRWKSRAKIVRMYDVLKEVDTELRKSFERKAIDSAVVRLTELEMEIVTVSVPLSYMQEFYNLRMHTSFMLDRLKLLQQEPKEPTSKAA
jgi:hypothetical protein